MIQGVILAAGRGSRLRHLTEKKPKTFNKLGRRSYIDIIINNFIKNNINKINIVVGYKKKFFKKLKYKKILNKKWKSTNIFFSLTRAKKILSSNTCIISYSDIIYDNEAIKLLMNENGDIVFLNNVNWKKIWKIRFKKPLNDLENFNFIKTNAGDFLTKIGGKVKKLSSINGQFAGLFKITPNGWKIILEFIKKNKIDITDLDITSFFSKFLKKYKKIIKVVHYNKTWFEIDSLSDFNKLNIYKNKII
jgi:choline kinase